MFLFMFMFMFLFLFLFMFLFKKTKKNSFFFFAQSEKSEFPDFFFGPIPVFYVVSAPLIFISFVF